MTVRLILSKSDNVVSITSDSEKDFGLYVIIKSMQVGFMGFLKQCLIFDNIFATVDLTEIFHSDIIWFYIKIAHKNKIFLLS